jgi:transcriptional regulator NrdR family protein
MKCPICKNFTSVSKTVKIGEYSIKRYRICSNDNCKNRFTTLEIMTKTDLDLKMLNLSDAIEQLSTILNEINKSGGERAITKKTTKRITSGKRKIITPSEIITS